MAVNKMKQKLAMIANMKARGKGEISMSQVAIALDQLSVSIHQS